MARPHKLTRKQHVLLAEIEQLADLFAIDYKNIAEYPPKIRTSILEAMKQKIVRGQVIIWYTVVDEYLNMEICNYYFGKKRGSIQLWRTKRFRFFNYYILEELYPLQKLRFVKSFKKIPKPVSRNIEILNSLRNGLAHALFVENLRKVKPLWKGKDIFSFEGAEAFMSDMGAIRDFFRRAKQSRRANSGQATP